MPADYYSQELDILGARVDQLVFAEVLQRYLPAVELHLRTLSCPVSTFAIQWFMCLFAKDLPMSLTMRVWDVLFVYGDTALFAVGLSMMRMAEPRLLSCTTMESLYEALKTLSDGILSRDAEAAHRLVLRSLDVLMRTSLAQFVEIERVKHRLALQQQEYERSRSRHREGHSPRGTPQQTPQQTPLPTPPPTPPTQAMHLPAPLHSGLLRLPSGVGEMGAEAVEEGERFPWHAQGAKEPWGGGGKASSGQASNSAATRAPV